MLNFQAIKKFQKALLNDITIMNPKIENDQPKKIL